MQNSIHEIKQVTFQSCFFSPCFSSLGYQSAYRQTRSSERYRAAVMYFQRKNRLSESRQPYPPFFSCVIFSRRAGIHCISARDRLALTWPFQPVRLRRYLLCQPLCSSALFVPSRTAFYHTYKALDDTTRTSRTVYHRRANKRQASRDLIDQYFLTFNTIS